MPTVGRTHPEAPGAVAVDSDGDYVVAYTAEDPDTGLDRTGNGFSLPGDSSTKDFCLDVVV